MDGRVTGEESNHNNVNKFLGDNSAPAETTQADVDILSRKVRFEIIGEEIVEKIVRISGNSGRAYLPPMWVGHKVKIVRSD